MTIYIICLFLILIQVLFSFCIMSRGIIDIRGKQAEINQILFIADSCLLVILAAFRNETVGTDARAYFHWIELLPNYSVSELFRWARDSGIEIGYAFVSKFSYSIFQSRQIVLVIINGIIYWGMYKFSKELSSNILISIYLFLTFSMFNQSLNISAQYVAAVFLILSIERAHRKEIKSYFIFLLCAISFHFSAIIGLIFLPIALFESKAVRYSILVVAIAFIGSLFAPRVINLVVSRTFYSIYLYKEIASESGVGVAINALIFLAYLLFYRQFKEYDEYAPIWLFTTALTLGLNLYIHELAMIGRIMVYFKMTYIVSIPNFLASFNDRKARMIVTTIVIVLFAVYYWHSISGSCFGTVPYISDALNILGN